MDLNDVLNTMCKKYSIDFQINNFTALSVEILDDVQISTPYSDFSFYPCEIYETPAEYPAIYGGDECGAGVRGMQSPSTLF